MTALGMLLAVLCLVSLGANLITLQKFLAWRDKDSVATRRAYSSWFTYYSFLTMTLAVIWSLRLAMRTERMRYLLLGGWLAACLASL